MFRTISDLGGPESVDSLNIIGYFCFCTPVEVKLITKVLSYFLELKVWFSTKRNDCNCDARLLSRYGLSPTVED